MGELIRKRGGGRVRWMGEWDEGERRVQGSEATELWECRSSELRSGEAAGMRESGVRERGGSRAGWIGDWDLGVRRGQSWMDV